MAKEIKVGILTVSDRCSVDVQKDESGPNLKSLVQMHLHRYGLVRTITGVVPDEVEVIANTLVHWSDVEKCLLILTSGGTGISPRDVTPEATRRVIEKETIGLTIKMISKSIEVTPMAMLSRPVNGVRGSTLILNLPGSRKGSQECFEFVLPALPHAFDLLQNNLDKVASQHAAMIEKPLIHNEPRMHKHQVGDESVLCLVDHCAGSTSSMGSKSDLSRPCSSHSSIGSLDAMEGVESPLPKYEPRASPLHTPCPTLNRGCRDSRISRVANRERKSPYPLLPVSKALSTILECVKRDRKRHLVNLHTGLLGKVLMEDIRSKEPYPPFPASVKDGYAVLASDGMGPRLVVDPVTAGQVPLRPIRKGQCARITTGAPIPPGADAVVQVEDTELLESADDGRTEVSVKIMVIPAVGQDIRKVGSDIALGETVIPARTKLGPAELGLLAMAGVSKVAVFNPPVIGIFSTGDELVAPGDDKPEGKIYDSNKITLLSACREQGFSAADLGVLSDNYQEVKDNLLSIVEDTTHDVIITTGGVSMGEKDLIKKFLEEFGDVKFGQVHMKPGKPTTFATLGRGTSTTYFFALPGNPVSALVTFYLFALPAIRKLAGHKQVHMQRIQVKLGFDVRLDPRPEYHRVQLNWDTEDGVPVALTTGNQTSSRLLSMRSCHALLELPGSEAPRVLHSGNMVTALLIPQI